MVKIPPLPHHIVTHLRVYNYGLTLNIYIYIYKAWKDRMQNNSQKLEHFSENNKFQASFEKEKNIYNMD